MPNIQVLDPHVADLIAAGEVVERFPSERAIRRGPLLILILGGSEFRLREMFCSAKHIRAPPGASRLRRVPNSSFPDNLLNLDSSTYIRRECLDLTSTEVGNCTLKTEQSNQMYEEQVTEGKQKIICGTFLAKGNTNNFVKTLKPA